MSDESFSDQRLSNRSLPLQLRSLLPLLGALVVAGTMTSGMSKSSCAVACKPILSIKAVRFSQAQSLQRIWTASLIADRSYCATTSGTFEIDFIRLKENAPDLQFTEPFTWRPGEFEVSVVLWADEAIDDYRIGFIAPCVCRDPLRLTRQR